MKFFTKRARLALALLAAAFAAAPSGAELAKWDQARATRIAQQLTQACDAWRLAVREQPPEAIGSGVAREEFGMVQKAQLLHEESRALAAHLAKGEGHDQTLNLYRALKETVDDIEVLSQRAELEEPTLDAWAKVADLLRQIAPYYDPKALSD
jgi:hypothetical protein